MYQRHIEPYFFALRVVWQSSRKWTIARFVLILLQSLLPLISLYLMKLIIDTVMSKEQLTMDVFPDVRNYLILFGIVLLLQAAATTLTQLVTDAQQQKVSDYMTEIVHTQALTLDLSYFENSKFHNTHFQAQKDALIRPMRIVSSLMATLQHTIALILLSGFLSFMHIGVALVLVLSIVPTIVIKYRFSQKLYNWTKSRIAKERESHYLNMVMGDHHHAKELRVFNAGEKLRLRFKKIRRKLFSEKLQIGKLRTRITLLAKLFEITAEVGVYVFIVYRTIHGTITVGDMVIYFQAFHKGKTNLTSALEAFVQLVENRMFLTYIRDFLGLKSRLKPPSVDKALAPKTYTELTFRQVGFRYPEQATWAVKDVSVSFKKGQLCAVVGENGSGKSTLIKLLCRLYDPEQGEVLLDNKPLPNYELKAYQKHLSVTFQDFVKYQFTVTENITLDDNISTQAEKLRKAAEITGASEFIDALPGRFDQKLGKQFNDGVDISLGQWQKIAIARSMYRDAEIILMDEPTSAIDPLAEHRIFENLKEMARDKIIILVTHRIYNLKIADKIIVMDHGNIIESGRHDELIAQKGKYASMFEKQLHQ